MIIVTRSAVVLAGMPQRQALEVPMLRRTIVGAALALAVLAACPFASAGDSADATDANIVTALDISDSVATADARAQIAALAAAVRAPEFLEAVGRGATGRVALSVFVWHHYRYEVLPWTVIASHADAEAAAREIETRIPVNVDHEARMTAVPFIGRLTDISLALDHAAKLLADMRTASGPGGRQRARQRPRQHRRAGWSGPPAVA